MGEAQVSASGRFLPSFGQTLLQLAGVGETKRSLIAASIADAVHASPDITRPTLKRLTADQQPHTPDTASQIWKTKQPPSRTNGKQPSTQPTTPLANNPNRIKGDRDVLIHRVERGHSLPGIALSYGISLPALRKANAMWPSDPLTLKTTLRIPLGLCNLPPSKKIEIEQDSGQALVWEHEPEPPPLPHRPSLDCAASDSSDHLAQRAASSSGPRPPHTTQLGQLPPISNDGSPPPSPQPTVAALERVPADQLGFFTSLAPSDPRPSPSTHPDDPLPIPARKPSPASSSLRQRSLPAPSSKKHPLPIAIPSAGPSRTTGLSDTQISPDSQKKLAVPRASRIASQPRPDPGGTSLPPPPHARSDIEPTPMSPNSRRRMGRCGRRRQPEDERDERAMDDRPARPAAPADPAAAVP
ncbi:hypothetical protein PtA15_12A329 [Puccinia triticina]|uniref:LysM domain-containing protein n=1 Tax=Puccinia triticina TaxID=208348 RepID=A0ABY7CZF6_9BASI|nr:uncharacterized protein PtA15_12A329 [Puccinia triticina]WAQ90340.1 hypothetical protein PtA15_12A329 [Puccinia triticina]